MRSCPSRQTILTARRSHNTALEASMSRRKIHQEAMIEANYTTAGLHLIGQLVLILLACTLATLASSLEGCSKSRHPEPGEFDCGHEYRERDTNSTTHFKYCRWLENLPDDEFEIDEDAGPWNSCTEKQTCVISIDWHKEKRIKDNYGFDDKFIGKFRQLLGLEFGGLHEEAVKFSGRAECRIAPGAKGQLMRRFRYLRKKGALRYRHIRSEASATVWGSSLDDYLEECSRRIINSDVPKRTVELAALLSSKSPCREKPLANVSQIFLIRGESAGELNELETMLVERAATSLARNPPEHNKTASWSLSKSDLTSQNQQSDRMRSHFDERLSEPRAHAQAQCFNLADSNSTYTELCHQCLRYLADRIVAKSGGLRAANWRVADCQLSYDFAPLDE